MLSLMVTIGTGCQTNRSASKKSSEGEPVWTEVDDGNGQLEDTSEEGQVIIPITSSTGLVATVNEPLRFVVLDYALTGLPKIDQVLYIYRRGQKVARVKVTGPIRGQTVAADIIEGIAAKGDEVRAE
ncbi:hypothetical protein N8766_00675 [bacterium]|jgi:hypothetical protein|nr:hypothetical protein [bacterium]